MKTGALLAVGLAVTAACTPVYESYTRIEAIEFCQQKAREAAGPTGEATVGVNSRTGPNFGLSINLSDDYLRGRDPAQVYEQCMTNLAARGQISEGS